LRAGRPDISASGRASLRRGFQHLSPETLYESLDSPPIQADSRVPSDWSGSPMNKENATADTKSARYRQRLRASGAREVLFQLPDEMLALIDDIKKRQGLPSRSLALMQLIERGIQATQ